ncbi:hypothetical protein E2562_010602 [Oryza meyeriana var. granulata]|uniref:Uncharacterized protein n=1 Tax=Oryza meyeriana var. granulata TaxID=110450 RepID=A0A6G1BV66_9ORYZ|nr:hypothetical protein E2562_010602 [Oryza meyeriana var. granulata]
MEDHGGHHHLHQPPSLAYTWDPQLAPFDHAAGDQVAAGCSFSTASELRQALLRALAELDAARAAHQTELRRMESEAARLAALVASATAERDELRRHCHSLLLLLHHQSQSAPPTPTPQSMPAAHVPTTTIAHSGVLGGGGCAAAGVDELALDAADEAEREMALARRLPEKGCLVEAVVSAGPLLQTLLLAGPLPRWRHPPPPAPADIPPFNPGRPSPIKADAEASAGNNSFSSASATSSSPESNCSGGGGHAPLVAPALPYHMIPFCM